VTSLPGPAAFGISLRKELTLGRELSQLEILRNGIRTRAAHKGTNIHAERFIIYRRTVLVEQL
jgi:hypothetical protein